MFSSCAISALLARYPMSGRGIGAIPDVGARRIGRLGPTHFGHALDVIAIVYADAEERARDHGNFELHVRERHDLPGDRVLAPWRTIHFDHRIVLNDPERRLAARREPAPLHVRLTFLISLRAAASQRRAPPR